MSGNAPRPARLRGVAVITVMLIAAVTSAIAVGIAGRQRVEIARTSSAASVDEAVRLVRELEREAADTLAKDSRVSNTDDRAEPWATVSVSQRSASGSARGSLDDLQGRFNLTNLAPAHLNAGGPLAGESTDEPPQVSLIAPPAAPGASPGSAWPRPDGAPGEGAVQAGDDAQPRYRAWVCNGSECGWRIVSQGQAAAIIDEGWDDNQVVGDSFLAGRYFSGTNGAAAPAAEGNGLPGRDSVGPGSPDGAGPVQDAAAAPEDGQGGRGLSRLEVAEMRFRLLLQELGIEAAIVQAILDWTDADSDARFPNGAEDAYYLDLERPYRAANRPLASVRELLLVRGVTQAVFEKLAPHVTVIAEPTAINVNTAPETVLMSLGPGIDRSTATLLINLRETQAFTSVDAFLNHPLLLGRLLDPTDLSVRSAWFALSSASEVGALRLSHVSVFHRPAGSATVVARRRSYFDG